MQIERGNFRYRGWRQSRQLIETAQQAGTDSAQLLQVATDNENRLRGLTGALTTMSETQVASLQHYRLQSGYRLLHRAGGSATPGTYVSPNQYHALAFWYSSNYGRYTALGGSEVTVNGAPIGYWLDRSGNDRHVQQTTKALQGSLLLDAKNQQPAVRFSGSQYYELLKPFTYTTEFTVFVVARQNDTVRGSLLLANSGDASQYVGVVTASGYAALKKDRFVLAHNDTGNGAGGVVASRGLTIGTDWFIGSAIQGGTGATAWRNGVPGDTESSMSTATWTANLLGGAVDANYRFDGDLLEIFGYSRAIGAEERTALEQYCIDKYAPDSQVGSLQYNDAINSGLIPLLW